MELRTLRYFLAVCKEESITNAAEVLHMTQPTLSRQLRNLEKELGRKLFIRGSRKITLTAEGLFLQKRAEEILALAEATSIDITHQQLDFPKGLHIGCQEQANLNLIMPAIKHMKQKGKDLPVRFSYDSREKLFEKLDVGLIGFALVFNPFDDVSYASLKLNQQEYWNILMEKTDENAKESVIKPEMLAGKPIFLSQDASRSPWVTQCLGSEIMSHQIAGFFSLVKEAYPLVKAFKGYAIFQGHGESPYCCVRPLFSQTPSNLYLVWKHRTLMDNERDFLEFLTDSVKKRVRPHCII